MDTDADPEGPQRYDAAEDISKAVSLLEQGAVIVYPTETFYGLLCSAFDHRALGKLSAIKNRVAGSPWPLIIADENDLSRLAEKINTEQKLLMDRFWPGPLTLVFDAKAEMPDSITANTKTVGVRVPSHQGARELAQKAGPLVATSANLKGRPTPTDPDVIGRIFPDLPLFSQGELFQSKGSTVLDIRSIPHKILRSGEVPESLVAKCLATKETEGE